MKSIMALENSVFSMDLPLIEQALTAMRPHAAQISEAFDETIDALFRKIETLSSASQLSSSTMDAMKVAGIILISASFQKPSDVKTHAALLMRTYFKINPLNQESESQVRCCLDAVFSPEKLSESNGFREVFHDAVIALNARKDFSEFLIQQRAIFENESSSELSQSEWLDLELKKLKASDFKTFTGKIRYQTRLNRNIQEVQTLKSVLSGAHSTNDAQRLTLSLYRSMSRNMVDMISLADKKAGLLLSANAISLSILVTFFGRGLSDHPALRVAATLIIATSALTVIFAAFAARPLPRVHKSLSLNEAAQQKLSILHYGHAARMSEEDFIQGFREVMHDPELLERGLLQELHFFSVRIISKFWMVRIAYLTMTVGIFLSCMALIFSKYL